MGGVVVAVCHVVYYTTSFKYMKWWKGIPILPRPTNITTNS